MEPWTFYFLNGFLNFNVVFPLALLSLPVCVSVVIMWYNNNNNLILIIMIIIIISSSSSSSSSNSSSSSSSIGLLSLK